MSAPVDWRAWSEEERQAQVSPSSVIGGDYEPYVERYLRESREAVDLLHGTSTLGVVVSDSGYPVDVFLSPTNGGPVLVYIHGGYWQDLDRQYSRFAAPALAEIGWGCVVVGYPIAPGASIPMMIDVCASALRWTKSMLQPSTLVVAGSSAGAHLAACAAALTDAHVDGLLLFSGVYELEPLIGTSVNDALALDAEEASALSPIVRKPCVAPTFLSWGEHETDWFKSISRRYADYLRTYDIDVSESESPGRNHFDVVHDLQSGGSPVQQWLRQLGLQCPPR